MEINGHEMRGLSSEELDQVTGGFDLVQTIKDAGNALLNGINNLLGGSKSSLPGIKGESVDKDHNGEID